MWLPPGMPQHTVGVVADSIVTIDCQHKSTWLHTAPESLPASAQTPAAAAAAVPAHLHESLSALPAAA